MVNKVILVGNLGASPELKHTGSGVPVCTFNIATSEKWKDKSGEMQQKTEWHRIVVWQQQAESCNEFLSKGSSVYIEGKIQSRKWQDQEGNEKVTVEIQAREVKFLNNK